MSTLGRNDPCPCGSGRKVKKCHPEALGPGGWSPGRNGATSGPPSSVRALPRLPPAPPPPAPDPIPPTPTLALDGAGLARMILASDLSTEDLRKVREALSEKHRLLRAAAGAAAQSALRPGMAVGFGDPEDFGRNRYREGVVRSVKRTRVLVDAEGGLWNVSAATLRILSRDAAGRASGGP